MARPPSDTEVLEHLQEVANAKRALLKIGADIADENPVHANTILIICRALTRSADKLLGDTVVTG